MKWEYKFVKFAAAVGVLAAAGEFDIADATRVLNELGAEGWEAVNAFDTNVSGGRTGSAVILLKRAR